MLDTESVLAALIMAAGLTLVAIFSGCVPEKDVGNVSCCDCLAATSIQVGDWQVADAGIGGEFWEPCVESSEKCLEQVAQGSVKTYVDCTSRAELCGQSCKGWKPVTGLRP